jgi:hypothetical protein
VLVYNLKDSTSLPIQFFKIAPEFNINEIKEDFISNFDIEGGTHNFLFQKTERFLFLSAGRGLFKIDSSNGAVINHIGCKRP